MHPRPIWKIFEFKTFMIAKLNLGLTSSTAIVAVFPILTHRHGLKVFSLVWGNCGKTSSNKLQKLPNRAARVITSSSYDVDVDSLFRNLSWKELHSQRQIQKAFMVFKSLNGLVPEYLTSICIKLCSEGFGK